jgi:hypothetical protein
MFISFAKGRWIVLYRKCGLLLCVVIAFSFSSDVMAEWRYNKGKGYVLCDAVKDRLNRHSFPDPLKVLNNCAWHVVATYEGFKEPPWEELDPAQYEELIGRLLKYRMEGAKGYFSLHARDDLRASEDKYKKEARDFIGRGGRLQLWRTRLVSQLNDMPAPQGVQNVVQLRFPIDSKQVSETCSGVPIANWMGNLFILNDDLSEPDRRVAKGRDSQLFYSSLLLFSGVPHFISSISLSVSISKDMGSGPSNFCELTYFHKVGT